MKSAIADLLSGKRGRSDLFKLTEEIKTLSKRAIAAEKKITGKLEPYPGLTEMHEETSNLIDEMHLEESYLYYAEGFRFGFLLALDVLQE